MIKQAITPVSPDLSKMQIRIHDKAMKATFFFSSPEQYQRYLDKLANAEPVSLKKGGRKSKKEVEEVELAD